MEKILRSDISLDDVVPNIAIMLQNNVARFGEKEIFCERTPESDFNCVNWKDFYSDVLKIASNLRSAGVEKQDKVVLFCPNSLNMLKTEMAIMASGAIAVPIFAYFKRNTAELLIHHADAKYLIIDGPTQFSQLGADLGLKKIWTFNEIHSVQGIKLTSFSDLLSTGEDLIDALYFDADPDDICLNMYTSGTMGTPKCVQLTHRNILSQQAAIKKVLQIQPEDRFLSYLPWHHSFGGIFELFSALSSGASYHLESSLGKDLRSIFENWMLVKPTVFFSVPKVYQSLIEFSNKSKEAELLFFNSGLKFIFTAASALPARISEEFQKRGIAVIEGWGLTETSPCCTLTDPSLKREPGVVGKPIPGVQLRIAADGEIQVSGPNIMKSYYKNDEANAEAFTPDGWYRSGDIGEITDAGLRLISRKDRIFKLSNGEKVIPTELERAIEHQCHYVQYVVVSGSGEDYPVALIFPNNKLLNNPDYAMTMEEGCFCPRNINELGKCLTGCLKSANDSIGQKFAKIKVAAIIAEDLSIDANTLTPSMKVAPRNVIEKYRDQLLSMYGTKVPKDEEVYLIEL